jgi:hypothetical protein
MKRKKNIPRAKTMHLALFGPVVDVVTPLKPPHA